MRKNSLLSRTVLSGALLVLGGPLAAPVATASGPSPSDPRVHAGLLDGRWDQMPPVHGGVENYVVYDPVRHRMLVIGQGEDDWIHVVWEMSLSGEPRWAAIAPKNDGPPITCCDTRAVYDPVRDRVIVYGMTYDLQQTWAFRLSPEPEWEFILTAGALPPGRSAHAMIYDSLRDRLVVFGGWIRPNGVSTRTNEVWALSLSAPATWSQLQPSGTAPPPCNNARAIYDPVRDRMVVFGGTLEGGSYGGCDVLDFETMTWAPLVAAGPSPPARAEHGLWYVPSGDRMMVFGGRNGTGCLSDVWSLDLSTSQWTPVEPVGSPPPCRSSFAAIHDSPGERMVLFAGNGYRDVWSLTFSSPTTATWAQLDQAIQPVAREGASAILDGTRDRMIVFGGRNGSTYFDDLWVLEFSSGRWARVEPEGQRPTSRAYHVAIHDAQHDRMVVFGGYPYTDETWALGLSGPPEWTPLALSAQHPSPRAHASAIYDPLRDRIVLFGGENGTPAGYFNDLWSLDLSDPPTWSVLGASGALPTAREGHSAIYDPVGDRMVMFGGYSYYVVRNDLWTLSLAGTPTWTAWNAGSLPSRSEHAAFYDAGRDRLVIHGGIGTRETRLDDSWGLILRNGYPWTKLDPGGFSPHRNGHAAVYDPARGRAVIFGGGISNLPWVPYDFTSNDAYSLTWGDPLAEAPIEVPADIAVSLPRPNPSDRAVSFEFDLPHAASIIIDILDLQGRRVRSLERGLLPPGRHKREWDGFDEHGGRAPAGVYFVRLRDPEGTAYRRILRVP